MLEPFALIYTKMGWTGIVLALFAIAAGTVFIAKLYQFWRMQLWSSQRAATALQQILNQQYQEARLALASAKNPAGKLLYAALISQETSTKPEQIKDEMLRVGTQQLNRVESHFRILDVIANLSPLLGLLGTVLGMIGAFTALEAAGMRVDPAVLSGGISLALLTTAAGLIIAIPSIAALNYLESIAQKQRHFLSDITSQYLASLAPQIPKTIQKTVAVAHDPLAA